ncbi:Uncharacterised protein [Shigella sonnei]|nr:Uncharacterised protein [Shigella sonnei]
MVMQRRCQQRANIGKTERVGGLVAITFAHAARKRNDFGRNTCGQQTGLHQCLRERRERSVNHFDNQFCHPPGNLHQLRAGQRTGVGACAEALIHNHLPRFMSVNHAPLAVGFQQATTDVEAGSAADFSGIEQGVVRSATADVNIQYPTQPLFRKGLCPGTVTGNDGFEVRPGAGNDKIAQRLGEHHHRRTSIAGFRAFTGDDDGTRINAFRRNARSLILLED